MSDSLVIQLKHELNKTLPGEAAQNLMIPETRRHSVNISSKKKPAAVMILLYPVKGIIHTCFIQRTEYNGSHSGQISFPGGMKEKEDLDLHHTAIRETIEETGIKGKAMEYLGKLTPLYIPVSNFLVHPYVSIVSHEIEFHPDSEEVEFMIPVPLPHLMDKTNRKREKWNIHGRNQVIPFFSYKQFRIWGATAMILSEFINLAEAVEPGLWFPGYSGNDYIGK